MSVISLRGEGEGGGGGGEGGAKADLHPLLHRYKPQTRIMESRMASFSVVAVHLVYMDFMMPRQRNSYVDTDVHV